MEQKIIRSLIKEKIQEIKTLDRHNYQQSVKIEDIREDIETLESLILISK